MSCPAITPSTECYTASDSCLFYCLYSFKNAWGTCCSYLLEAIGVVIDLTCPNPLSSSWISSSLSSSNSSSDYSWSISWSFLTESEQLSSLCSFSLPASPLTLDRCLINGTGLFSNLYYFFKVTLILLNLFLNSHPQKSDKISSIKDKLTSR